jgi:hypothetical protein
MKNLTPEQRTAAAHAYRNSHHMRLHHVRQRANGEHLLSVRREMPDGSTMPVALVALNGRVVSTRAVKTLTVCFSDVRHLEESVIATLDAFAHADRALADAFVLASDPECSTSLPMILAA